MRSRYLLLLALSAIAHGQTQPSTAPADATVDWLLGQGSAAAPAAGPTTLPATVSASPLTRHDAASDARKGTITLSDGSVITGEIRTTPGKPVRVWVESIHQYVDIPFKAIVSAKAGILWERDEKEWHFIASGSDIKEYTGKTYPARETTYQFTLTNGKTVSGGVVAPLYVTTPEGEKLFVLDKRAKGEVGQSLRDLRYVQTIQFND
jgi:hypothetical protein